MSKVVDFIEDIYDGEMIQYSSYKASNFTSEELSEEDRVNYTGEDITPPEGYELDHIDTIHSESYYGVGSTELLPLIFWLYFFKVYWKLIKP